MVNSGATPVQYNQWGAIKYDNGLFDSAMIQQMQV